MLCDEFEEQVHQLLDQRQAPWSRERLHEHAASCAPCQELLSSCEALLDGLKFHEVEGPKATFSQLVVAEVTTVRRKRRIYRTFAAAALAIAASLVLTLLPTALSWRSTTHNASPREVTATDSPSNVPAQALPAPANNSDKIEMPPLEADDVQQVTALLAQWRSRWSTEQWKPVDRIEGGLAPITTTLSIAIDEIRATIPLGRTASPTEEPADSAGIRLDVHLAHTA